ncbi:MAG: T9SS type A sorting domain-containing protein [Gemmatimonadetes bacterium]|nr:T9SS type A sorting domain-containing protein [Gemmatimonadota bacterium]
MPHFAETYEAQPIEAMIEQSDLVVIGTVEKTSVYDENGTGDVRRETTIRIQEFIKGGGNDTRTTVVVDHFEGSPGSNGLATEEYSDFRPVFIQGEQALFLLVRRGDRYQVTGDFRGKIDLIGDTVAGTSTNVTDFKEAIKRVDSKQNSTLGVQMVPIEYQLAKVRAASGKRAAKATSAVGYHLDGQFYAVTSARHHPPPLTITFHINPDGAIDKDGNPIPFSDLRTAMNACVAEWNRIEDGHIKFRVASTATSRRRNISDSWSTVTFDAFGGPGGKAATATYPKKRGGVVVSDIRLSNRYTWSTSATYPSSWTVAQPKDFRDVMTHELGHSTGIWHSNPKHKNNTMYYESGRAETKRRTLEWGDKAGGVYMTTAPGRAGDGRLDFDQDWSAFTGSSEAITLHRNITVPSGRTLTIESGLSINKNGYTITSTGGTINGSTAKSVAVTGPSAAATTLSVAPNPSNPSTTIRFNLPQPTAVSLSIYDMLGQRVHTLISNEYRQAGNYSVVWNGRDRTGQRTASGVYFINLRAGEQLYQEKLTLVH